MRKKLWKGNEAIAEAAVRAGCRFFAGYPITPQTEIPEYMSVRMSEAGGIFVQSESEISAVNMLYGAAASGVRCMTSSSGPGMSLKQEGISFLATAELPCVIVNIARGGPGLGGVYPAQSDYFQACKGGGHGDYHMLVLAPNSVPEAANLTMEAFDLADYYRNPVMILGDGMLGQMMESAEFDHVPTQKELPDKDWVITGTKAQRTPNLVTTGFLRAEDSEKQNRILFAKYAKMAENEARFEEYQTEDAEIIFVAYGITSRFAKSAVNILRAEGIKCGLFRPISLFPFPDKQIESLAKNENVNLFLTLELSMGQMVQDVRLAVNGLKPVLFYGRAGGMVMNTEEIIEEAKKICGGAVNGCSV